MKIELEQVLPEEIEKRSFEIITKELAGRKLEPENELVIKRAIHTTADFDYADNLVFSDHAVKQAVKALEEGVTIVTDTTMAWSGINKKRLAALGGKAVCFIGDEDVAEQARQQKTTRSAVSMEKAAGLEERCIFAIGNAPTALIRLYELIREGRLKPELIIGVPVGFVNVVQSKELILSLDVPYIVAKGRKGGSNVAAAICNALIYQTGK